MDDDNMYMITGGPLKPHEWVQIKAEMSAADEAWIQNKAMGMTGTKKNPQVQLLLGDIRLASLKRMIVAWQLTKTVKNPADGTESQVPIPLSEQAIENLPRRISGFINKKIDELNSEDEEDEQAFTNAANGMYGGSLETMRNPLQKG